MNWCDYIVIGLIIAFAFVGLRKGIVMTGFKVVSFFVCVFASMKLYPIASEMLAKTKVYTVIKNSVMKGLLHRGQEASASAAVPVSGAEGAETFLGTISLPTFLKESVTQKVSSPAEIINLESIMSAVGDEITLMVISVLALILLYIVLRIVMVVAGSILKGVSKLPLFKQIDGIGGLIFGALQGLLAVNILFALLLIVNTDPRFEPVFKGLENSLFAGGFYENNFIINWMFP